MNELEDMLKRASTHEMWRFPKIDREQLAVQLADLAKSRPFQHVDLSKPLGRVIRVEEVDGETVVTCMKY